MSSSFANTVNWFTLVYSFLATALVLASCAAPSKAGPNPEPAIVSAQDTTKNVAEGMTKAADNIDKHVKDARNNTPEKSKPILFPSFDGILHETNTIRELRGQLDAANTQLEQAKEDSKTLVKQNEKLIDDNNKLKEERNGALQKLFYVLIGLSVVGVGISAVMIYTKQPYGIALGIGSVTTLALSIVLVKYWMWFALGGGILLVSGIGYIAYRLFKHRNGESNANEQVVQEQQKNSILSKAKDEMQKIGEELVQTIEANKMAMQKPARLHLFGNAAIPGHIDVIQSPKTKAFVSSVRAKKHIRLAPSVPGVSLAPDTQ